MYRYYKFLPVALFVLSCTVFTSGYAARGGGGERGGGERNFNRNERNESGQHNLGGTMYEHNNPRGFNNKFDANRNDFFHGNPYNNSGSGTTVVVPESYDNDGYNDVGGPPAGTNYYQNSQY